MYGGSRKLGRGGGGAKRNIHSSFVSPPLHRPSSAAGGRLSMGGTGAAFRNRSSSASAATTSSAAVAEESFSLVTGNPLNFAMIIRLAPDLVEQIKKVEAQGSTTQIKFDANANNPAGNVISVGDKDFRFTWSPETGELCDIYEERRSGEDGNGLLVESGCAWRKLNVQRVLDESTKNHVKMRSEEAERKLKSRKAIVLDHGNPSMKRQMKALTASESNPWKMPFKQKKEQPPLKKRKAELPSGPPKSVQKSALTTPTPPNGRPPASPLSSQPDQSGCQVSPFGYRNLSKGHANVEDTISSQVAITTTSSEKNTADRLITSAQEKPGCKGFKRAQHTDLRSMLISLLLESPSKGMSLKALEKAIGDAIPSSAKQIEPILKKIATYQAPAGYFLKPGAEIESSKKPFSESQSSPDDNRHLSASHEKYDQQPAQFSFVTRADNKELEDQVQLNSESDEAPNSLENVNVLHDSADLFGEKKVPENREGPVGSSSASGSDTDSESDSSDNGSDSGSHSRSPAGSGSESSSDSESDASTNSKGASDEDVDIMTSNDDKEAKHRLESTGLGSPKSPALWRTTNGESGHVDIDEKQDGYVSNAVEDMLREEHVGEWAVVGHSVPNREGERHVGEAGPPSHSSHEHQGRHETDILSKDVFKNDQSEISEKVRRGKHKRTSDEKHFEDKPDRVKRLKAGNSKQPQISGSRTSTIVESHQSSPPDIPFGDPHRDPNLQMTNRMTRDGNTGFGSQRGYDHATPGRSKTDPQQSSRLVDSTAQAKSTPTTERQDKHPESTDGSGVKHPGRSLKLTGGFPMQRDKFNREVLDDYTTNKTLNSQNSAKVESMNISNRFVGNGRAKVLQRELSDLELGEFRESLPEERPGFAKQIESRNFFKKSESLPLRSEILDSDSIKGKPPGKIVAETSRPSLLDSNIPVSGDPEGIPRRGIPEPYAEDLSRPHQRVAQFQHRQHPSGVDPNDSGPQNNRVVAPQVRGNPQNKILHGAPQAHEARLGVVPPSKKENKRQKSNSISDLNDKQKDASLTGSCDGGQKRRESSSDENSCPYTKYDKKEPELKGPIKSFSQYKDHVKEFQEKYEAYVSIHKILDAYKEEFEEYGKEYVASKGRDRERSEEIEKQLRDAYRPLIDKHKRLKRIYLLLHQEVENLKKMIKEFGILYTKDGTDE